MPNNFVYNSANCPLYSIDYGTSTNGTKRLLLSNNAGSLIVDPSVTLPNSQGLMFTAVSGVITINNISDVVAIKCTNPSDSGVYMVVSSITVSSYDTSINARFSYNPSFSGGTRTKLTPVSNNSGSAASSQLTVFLNIGAVETSDEVVIANMLFPTSITTFQAQGFIIVAPNTSAGFRGISILKNCHMALNVSWLEIPTSLFY